MKTITEIIKEVINQEQINHEIYRKELTIPVKVLCSDCMQQALSIQRAEFEKEIDEKLDYLEQTLPDKSGRTTEEDEIVETLEELKQMLKEKA